MSKYNTNHIELKHVGWFVLGAVNSYCDYSGALGKDEYTKRLAYYDSTLEIVWKYLRIQDGLDGSCSDMACSVAHEAFKVFKPVLESEMWKVECAQILQDANRANGLSRAINHYRDLTGQGLVESMNTIKVLQEELRDGNHSEVYGGICEFCGQPNIDHMDGPCAEQRRRGL